MACDKGLLFLIDVFLGNVLLSVLSGFLVWGSKTLLFGLAILPSILRSEVGIYSYEIRGYLPMWNYLRSGKVTVAGHWLWSCRPAREKCRGAVGLGFTAIRFASAKSSGSKGSMSYWYVLRSKSYNESVVESRLMAKGYDAFCPHLRVQPATTEIRKAACAY